MHDDATARFWAKVDRSGDCWLWTGGRTMQGYGIFTVDRRRTYAHRFSYELHRGPIAVGLFVCHSCDVRLCVRPDHFFLGTNADNLHDASVKGRLIRGDRQRRRAPVSVTAPSARHFNAGSRNRNAKLTESDVVAIVAALRAGDGPTDVASRYGVTRSYILQIGAGRAWRHVAR